MRNLVLVLALALGQAHAQVIVPPLPVPLPTPLPSPPSQHWYLFLHTITFPADGTKMPDPPTQIEKRYDDVTLNGRVQCDAEGAQLAGLLNNPAHVGPMQKITWTCGFF